MDRGRSAAFACPVGVVPSDGYYNDHQMGMSIREKFAESALIGLLSGRIVDGGGHKVTPSTIAEVAVEYADALLEALED